MNILDGNNVGSKAFLAISLGLLLCEEKLSRARKSFILLVV